MQTQTSFLDEIWRTITLCARYLVFEASEITRKVAFIRQGRTGETDIQLYLRGLRRIALTVVLFPLALLALGIAGNVGTLVAVAGMAWAATTVALLFVAAPLGLLIEALLEGPAGSGTRYVQATLGVILIELGFTLFISIVPIRNNLAALPIAVVAASILGVLGAMGVKTRFTKRWIGFVATCFLITFTFSCFFPNTFRELKQAWVGMDDEVARVLRDDSAPHTTPVTGVSVGNRQTFLLSAGERRSTVWIEPGWHYKILSNKRCLIFTEEGPQRVYEVTANIPQCWKGAGLSGNILMGGVEDGTVVEFWRTQ